MSSLRRALGVLLGAVLVGWTLVTATLACSPPFEEPTIRALGPAQVVVVGTIGDRVAGGRLFHVERSYNGGVTATPIVIAFKEGEPVGDCSYPLTTGTSLIIAPYREPDGRLSADLGTLQADPVSDDGKRYIAEATSLYGRGVVPPPLPVAPESSPAPDVRLLVAAVAASVGLVFVVVLFIARGQRAGSRRG